MTKNKAVEAKEAELSEKYEHLNAVGRLTEELYLATHEDEQEES